MRQLGSVRAPSSARPHLESLETRLAPAAHALDGVTGLNRFHDRAVIRHDGDNHSAAPEAIRAAIFRDLRAALRATVDYGDGIVALVNQDRFGALRADVVRATVDYGDVVSRATVDYGDGIVALLRNGPSRDLSVQVARLTEDYQNAIIQATVDYGDGIAALVRGERFGSVQADLIRATVDYGDGISRATVDYGDGIAALLREGRSLKFVIRATVDYGDGIVQAVSLEQNREGPRSGLANALHCVGRHDEVRALAALDEAFAKLARERD